MQLILSVDDFKENLIQISDQSIWSSFSKEQMTFDEFIQTSTEQRKYLFNSYVEEADILELVESDYWEGIFKNKPMIENNKLKGVSDE